MDCRTPFQRRPDLFTWALGGQGASHTPMPTHTRTHSPTSWENPLLSVQYTSIIDEYFFWLALSSPCQFLSLSLYLFFPVFFSAPALPPYLLFNLVVLFSVGLCPDLLWCLLAVCLPPFLGVKQHHTETGEQHRHHVTDPQTLNYNFKAEV